MGSPAAPRYGGLIHPPTSSFRAATGSGVSRPTSCLGIDRLRRGGRKKHKHNKVRKVPQHRVKESTGKHQDLPQDDFMVESLGKKKINFDYFASGIFVFPAIVCVIFECCVLYFLLFYMALPVFTPTPQFVTCLLPTLLPWCPGLPSCLGAEVEVDI